MPSILELLREDLRTHREGFLAQGFWAIACHRISRPRLACKNRFVRKVWGLFNLLSQKLIELTCGISIPEGVSLGRRICIEHFGGIIVHSFAVIGDDCVLHQGVTLGNKGRKFPNEAPRLGNRVQVGAGAKILGMVTIGDDVVIGANSVVIADIPSGVTVAGVPARILGQHPARVHS